MWCHSSWWTIPQVLSCHDSKIIIRQTPKITFKKHLFEWLTSTTRKLEGSNYSDAPVPFLYFMSLLTAALCLKLKTLLLVWLTNVNSQSHRSDFVILYRDWDVQSFLTFRLPRRGGRLRELKLLLTVRGAAFSDMTWLLPPEFKWSLKSHNESWRGRLPQNSVDSSPAPETFRDESLAPSRQAALPGLLWPCHLLQRLLGKLKPTNPVLPPLITEMESQMSPGSVVWNSCTLFTNQC